VTYKLIDKSVIFFER